MDKIQKIKVSELFPFPSNPFKVKDDAELEALTESIRDFGVICPLIIRHRDGSGYEIISGHRRTEACKKAGIDEIPAFVRELDKDTATIAMIDSNLQREHILPSERAFAYKMKLDAIKHQGVTCRQVVDKLKSADLLGKETDESGRQVQRYIRLTELIPSLLELVDEQQIAFSPAVELSYLAQKEQMDLLEVIESEDCTPSLSQAQRLKKLSAEGRLDMDTIYAILQEAKPNQKEQIKLKKDTIDKFFPKNYSAQQMEEVIMKLLEQWQRKREKSKDVR
ncbi:MAG: ParB/RepB/Spo0J family partition protein [Eubacteriales bacterium]|nr:ParB/RepB/Spo0J family partition protein [Clostridia bacterium]MDD4495490.1 ParB/RepB/Spo0J family partition protein [Eubacteriales bacterium]